MGDVAVFGVPNDDWGESVQAVIQLKPGVQPSEEIKEELLDFAKERLAKFKLPRGIDFSESLPRLDTGKLYKRYLRDEYAERAKKEKEKADLADA